MPQPKKEQLLQDAAKLMGVRPLADALEISEAKLVDWMTGAEVMPDRKLAGLASLLLKFAKRQTPGGG